MNHIFKFTLYNIIKATVRISELISYSMKPYIKEMCSVMKLISLIIGLISTYHPSGYHPRKRKAIFSITKEALIGAESIESMLLLGIEN